MDNERTVEANFRIVKRDRSIFFDADVSVWKSPTEVEHSKFRAECDPNKRIIQSYSTSKYRNLERILHSEVRNFFAELDNDEVHRITDTARGRRFDRVDPLKEWTRVEELDYRFADNYEL